MGQGISISEQLSLYCVVYVQLLEMCMYIVYLMRCQCNDVVKWCMSLHHIGLFWRKPCLCVCVPHAFLYACMPLSFHCVGGCLVDVGGWYVLYLSVHGQHHAYTSLLYVIVLSL